MKIYGSELPTSMCRISIAFKLSPLTTAMVHRILANLATTWEKKTPYGTNNLTSTCQKLDYIIVFSEVLCLTPICFFEQMLERA